MGIKNNVKLLTLLAMIISLSVVGRVNLSFIPNVQPVTSIIIISTLILGIRSGLIISIITVLVTNLILGSGLWSIPQIISWGLISILAGLLKPIIQRNPFLFGGSFAFLSGIIFGVIMSLWNSILFSAPFLPYFLAGIFFDLNHAFGNVIFFVLLLPILSKGIERYFKKPNIFSRIK